MEYELRSWFDGDQCLYTDDRRIKDAAILAPGVRVTATYFRGPSERQPFAWDIVGGRSDLGRILSGLRPGAVRDDETRAAGTGPARSGRTERTPQMSTQSARTTSHRSR